MKGGALFCGVGGMELALEAVGVECAWGCDSTPFAARVFEQRFGVPVMPDVREIDAGVERVDWLAGGFPCQDLSSMGRGAGLDGERSGLWSEFARVIGLMRPRVVLIENVPMLLRKHFGRLLRDLRDLGMNAEWDVIAAAAVGAPHMRERLWIVAFEGDGQVFGDPVGLLPIASVDGDDDRAWPRAGRMAGSDVWELEPLAPKAAVLAGLRLAADAPVFERLLPTPVANDDGKSPEAHMAMKSRMPGGARRSITSLAVLARNGFVQADGSSAIPWATPTAHERTHRPRRVDHGQQLANQVGGHLNPTWEEWLMGFPVGWTDVEVGKDELAPSSWLEEVGPRTLAVCPGRTRRLRALGNAIVWKCALVAASRAAALPALAPD